MNQNSTWKYKTFGFSCKEEKTHRLLKRTGLGNAAYLHQYPKYILLWKTPQGIHEASLFAFFVVVVLKGPHKASVMNTPFWWNYSKWFLGNITNIITNELLVIWTNPEPLAEVQVLLLCCLHIVSCIILHLCMDFENKFLTHLERFTESTKLEAGNNWEIKWE